MAEKMIEVGRTHKSMWEQVEEGLTNDFPGAVYEVTERNTRFPELSKGVIKVPESISKQFLELKKQMKRQNGGRWIIE